MINLGIVKDSNSDNRKRSNTNTTNDFFMSLLEVNRTKIRKIFDKHVFQGGKNMEKDEINKILKNLNIFPDLVTNYDIKKLIEIHSGDNYLQKSPRARYNDESIDKDTVISYNEFEAMLITIANKAFNTKDYTDQKTMNESIYSLLNYIKDQAKIVYQVNLSTEAKINFKMMLDSNKHTPAKESKSRLSQSNMQNYQNNILSMSHNNLTYEYQRLQNMFHANNENVDKNQKE